MIFYKYRGTIITIILFNIIYSSPTWPLVSRHKLFQPCITVFQCEEVAIPTLLHAWEYPRDHAEYQKEGYLPHLHLPETLHLRTWLKMFHDTPMPKQGDQNWHWTPPPDSKQFSLSHQAVPHNVWLLCCALRVIRGPHWGWDPGIDT